MYAKRYTVRSQMLPLTKTIDIMACETFVVMMKQMKPCVLISSYSVHRSLEPINIAGISCYYIYHGTMATERGFYIFFYLKVIEHYIWWACLQGQQQCVLHVTGMSALLTWQQRYTLKLCYLKSFQVHIRYLSPLEQWK